MGMFAHILTNVDDEAFVRSQWESFTGESLSSYTVTTTTLSELSAGAMFLWNVLNVGRKDKRVLWIKADVHLRSVSDSLLRAMTGNVVLITKRNEATDVLVNSN